MNTWQRNVRSYLSQANHSSWHLEKPFPTASGTSAKEKSWEIRMSSEVPKAEGQGEDQMAHVAPGPLEGTDGTNWLAEPNLNGKWPHSYCRLKARKKATQARLQETLVQFSMVGTDERKTSKMGEAAERVGMTTAIGRLSRAEAREQVELFQ